METFTDIEGNVFNLNSNIYRPEQRDVNKLIVASVGRQLVAGTFRDF